MSNLLSKARGSSTCDVLTSQQHLQPVWAQTEQSWSIWAENLEPGIQQSIHTCTPKKGLFRVRSSKFGYSGSWWWWSVMTYPSSHDIFLIILVKSHFHIYPWNNFCFLLSFVWWSLCVFSWPNTWRSGVSCSVLPPVTSQSCSLNWKRLQLENHTGNTLMLTDAENTSLTI